MFSGVPTLDYVGVAKRLGCQPSTHKLTLIALLFVRCRRVLNWHKSFNFSSFTHVHSMSYGLADNRVTSGA